MKLRLQLSALFLMLCGGNGFIRAETVHEVAVGGNISVGCQFFLGGHTRIFCKDDCEEKDILVETSENNKCQERFCIEYKGKKLGYDVMSVSITNVTRSDSGRYQCVFKRRIAIASGIQEFRIKVTKDAALNPTVVLKPSYVTLTSAPDLAVQTGDSASTITVASPQPSTNQGPVPLHTSTPSEPQQNTTASASGLYFLLLLTLIPFILVTVLVIYKKRRHNNCEHSQNSQMNERIPALDPADDTYQSLSPDTRDNNQIYSTL